MAFVQRTCTLKGRIIKEFDPSMVQGLNPVKPMIGWDFWAQNIYMSYCVSRGDTNYWMPVDAVKQNEKDNKPFLKDLDDYVSEQNLLFWKNTQEYVASQPGWNAPRRSIARMAQLVCREPFVALMLPHLNSKNTEAVVFYKLLGSELRFTTLSVLINGFLKMENMDSKSKSLAKTLVNFVHRHCKFLKYHANTASASKIEAVANVKKFMGLYIYKNGLPVSKADDVLTHDEACAWLDSVRWDDVRLQIQPLAIKVFDSMENSHLIDRFETKKFALWSIKTEDGINKLSLPNIDVIPEPSSSSLKKKSFSKYPQLMLPWKKRTYLEALSATIKDKKKKSKGSKRKLYQPKRKMRKNQNLCNDCTISSSNNKDKLHTLAVVAMELLGGEEKSPFALV